MMSRFAQFKIFSIVFGAVYTMFFHYNWAPFKYYPAISKLTLENLPIADAGPAILWYAWLLSALVITLPITLLFPRKLADKLWDGWVWIGPVAVIVVMLFFEKQWFF